ncbi:MFS transporter [Rhodococcus sp. ACPA1]|uniref:MFS transporter n=1 Tax=Rhodococcus sp. ACPA1 TaxID=2028572 RepID=UPI000BB1256B|nr:MFS transporter [Rhodococcus sp. ACPA1]PBC51535.1 MFS transporter [Rhodococcus sp. ACPA1]
MSTTTQKKAPGRAAAAGFFGGAIEFYDFFIYGTASAIAFNALFFTELTPAIGTLVAFATLAVGYLIRPLGAVIFGHIGDRVGRKKALMATLYTMGGATILIGCLPTASAIGDWAAVLLVALRLIQGLGLGGEMGNAATLAMESSPKARRGFYSSFSYAGGFAGMVMATGVFALVHSLPKEAFMGWGWRIPFLLSAVLVVVAYAVRRQIPEPDTTDRIREEGRAQDLPINQVLRSHKKDVVLATLMATGPNTVYYIVAVFSLSYATTQYGVSQTTMLVVITISSALLCASVPAWGALSDRIGRRRLIIAGFVAEAVLTFVFFLALPSADPVLILMGMVFVLVFGHGIVTGTSGAFFPELFPAEVRASAVSLGQQLGGALSGLGPLVASAITVANPDNSMLVGVYGGGLCLLGAIAASLAVARWGHQGPAPEAAVSAETERATTAS